MYSSGDLIGLDCCCDECAQGHLGLQVFEELKYLLYSLFIVEVLEYDSSIGYRSVGDGFWHVVVTSNLAKYSGSGEGLGLSRV